jgi:hypothetical protein
MKTGLRWVGVALVWLGASAPSYAYEPTDKPLGKWERKAGKMTVSLVLEEGRLHISGTGPDAFTFHADYAVTRDGVAYGVITSVEIDEDSGKWEELHDLPFSFRFRVDEGALIIRDLRGEMKKDSEILAGRYRLVQAIPPRPVACYQQTGVAPPPPAVQPNQPVQPADPPLPQLGNPR